MPNSTESDGGGRMRRGEKARDTTAGSLIAGGIGKATGIEAGNLMDILIGSLIDIGRENPTGDGPRKPIVGGAVNPRLEEIETAATTNAVGIPSLMSVPIEAWRVIGRDLKNRVRVKMKPSQAGSMRASLHAQVSDLDKFKSTVRKINGNV